MTFITQLTHDDEYYDDEEGKYLFLGSLLDKVRRSKSVPLKNQTGFFDLKPEKRDPLHFHMHFFVLNRY